MRSRHKQSPTVKHTWEANSTYTAYLGVPDRRRYRRTPPGSPTVADLVRPGDTVSTSYSTGGVVIEVKEYFYAAPTGETLSHFTSSMSAGCLARRVLEIRRVDIRNDLRIEQRYGETIASSDVDGWLMTFVSNCLGSTSGTLSGVSAAIADRSSPPQIDCFLAASPRFFFTSTTKSRVCCLMGCHPG